MRCSFPRSMLSSIAPVRGHTPWQAWAGAHHAWHIGNPTSRGRVSSKERARVGAGRACAANVARRVCATLARAASSAPAWSSSAGRRCHCGSAVGRHDKDNRFTHTARGDRVAAGRGAGPAPTVARPDTHHCQVVRQPGVRSAWGPGRARRTRAWRAAPRRKFCQDGHTTPRSPRPGHSFTLLGCGAPPLPTDS